MTRIFVALFAVVFAMAGSAYAHSFNVLLVGDDVRNSGAYEGFRLATMERDGHAAEESDGHLGGLDVYIFSADSVENIQQSVDSDAIDIVVLLQDMPVEVEIYKLISQSELTQSDRGEILASFDFASRLEAVFSAAANEQAMRAYMAARIIEDFVRGNREFDNR